MAEEYERILLVKSEVFVYKIPPLASNRGHRAADWKLDSPDWVGRLRLVNRAGKLELRLEDKAGELFAKSIIQKYPGVDIESVQDSSRYFVVRLQDDSGRSAFIGVGFADRSDSFDMNVSMQDFFKDIEKETKLAEEVEAGRGKEPQPKLDLGFKAGQTITINLGGKNSGTSRPRPSATGGGGAVPLLPPPPPSGGGRIGVPPPPSGATRGATSGVSALDSLASLNIGGALKPATSLPAPPSSGGNLDLLASELGLLAAPQRPVATQGGASSSGGGNLLDF